MDVFFFNRRPSSMIAASLIKSASGGLFVPLMNSQVVFAPYRYRGKRVTLIDVEPVNYEELCRHTDPDIIKNSNTTCARSVYDTYTAAGYKFDVPATALVEANDIYSTSKILDDEKVIFANELMIGFNSFNNMCKPIDIGKLTIDSLVDMSLNGTELIKREFNKHKFIPAKIGGFECSYCPDPCNDAARVAVMIEIALGYLKPLYDTFVAFATPSGSTSLRQINMPVGDIAKSLGGGGYDASAAY